MTQNYFKGQITVVFPATPNNPLYGKILPVWGSKSNKGDQINFNVFALKENKKFPEEGGACEIDFKNSARWQKKNNGNSDYYIPNVPFTVYFKIKATKQKDGQAKLVAVSIFTPEKLGLEERTKADGITKQPSLQSLLEDEGSMSKLQQLEANLEISARSYPKDACRHKKAKKVADYDEEIDLDDDGAALDALMQEEWREEANNYHPSYSAPIDNSKDLREEIEEVDNLEGKEDETDYDEYEQYYTVEEHRKGRFDDADQK